MAGRRGRMALGGIFDPGGLFRDKQRDEHADVMAYGPTFFGVGPEARSRQDAYLQQMREEAGQGKVVLEGGLQDVMGATGSAQTLGEVGGRSIAAGQGSLGLAQGRNGILGGDALDSARWRANDVRNSGIRAAGRVSNAASNLRDTADQSAQGILAAAARPQTSLAEAQMQGAIADAQKQNLAMAAQRARGGNSALANRQALAANAAQSQDIANNFATLRANEEAALRDSQIAAANAAGQLRTGAAGQAGQLQGVAGGLDLSGAQGGAQAVQQGYNTAIQSNLDSGKLGLAQANMGAGLMSDSVRQHMAGGIAQSNIGADIRDASNDQFYRLGSAQMSADLGYGQHASDQRNKQETERVEMIENVFKSIFGGGMGMGMGG